MLPHIPYDDAERLCKPSPVWRRVQCLLAPTLPPCVSSLSAVWGHGRPQSRSVVEKELIQPDGLLGASLDSWTEQSVVSSYVAELATRLSATRRMRQQFIEALPSDIHMSDFASLSSSRWWQRIWYFPC